MTTDLKLADRENEQTNDAPSVTNHRANRWLVTAVAVLAAAVLGLVAWLIVGSESDDSAVDLTVQQQRLVDINDDVFAAANAGDGSAENFYAPNATMTTQPGPDETVAFETEMAPGFATAAYLVNTLDGVFVVGETVAYGDYTTVTTGTLTTTEGSLDFIVLRVFDETAMTILHEDWRFIAEDLNA